MTDVILQPVGCSSTLGNAMYMSTSTFVLVVNQTYPLNKQKHVLQLCTWCGHVWNWCRRSCTSLLKRVGRCTRWSKYTWGVPFLCPLTALFEIEGIAYKICQFVFGHTSLPQKHQCGNLFSFVQKLQAFCETWSYTMSLLSEQFAIGFYQIFNFCERFAIASVWFIF